MNTSASVLLKQPLPVPPSNASRKVTGFLSGLEKRPLAELLFKDVLAFNLPKISLTRTWAECADTATLELSNSAITLFSSLGAPPLLRHPASWLSGIDRKELEGEVSKSAGTAVKLARLGVAYGFLFPFGAAFWAIPFFRNWLTLQRTQSANFESIIGFDDKENKGQPKRSFEAEKDYQKNMALKIFLSGISLGAASLAGFSLLARRMSTGAQESMQKTGEAALDKARQFLEARHPQLWNAFFEASDLKGSGANQVAPGNAQLLFWGLPAYVGWIHAARGKNERRERSLQAFNGMFWFFFGGKVTALFFNKAYSKLAAACQPELWRKDFLEKTAGVSLPSEDWAAHFRKNEVFMDKLRNRLKDLSYAEIEEHALDKTSEAYQSLIHLKNWKFAVSGLATPIIALSLVQWLNFYITAQKMKEKTPSAVKTPSSPSLSPVGENATPFVSRSPLPEMRPLYPMSPPAIGPVSPLSTALAAQIRPRSAGDASPASASQPLPEMRPLYPLSPGKPEAASPISFYFQPVSPYRANASTPNSPFILLDTTRRNQGN